MKLMYLLFFSIAMWSSDLVAQNFRGADKSPMDIAYFPDNFAHDRKGNDEALIRVVYSRPQKKDRGVFGELIEYDKVWRLGANENTEVKLYKDATIGGKKLKAGTYSLFAIPGESEWTIIFSKALDYWGAYSYNQSNDAMRIAVPTESLSEPVEYFSIGFEAFGEEGAKMFMGWDKTFVAVPIDF